MNHFVTVCSRTAVAAACTAGTAVVSSAGIVAAGRDTVGSWDIAFLPSRFPYATADRQPGEGQTEPTAPRSSRY